MKNITLWQRLRQVSISTSLRCAFLMGALLTLIVSSVSLYSWHEQSSQIRYSLDEYFPRIHSAFLIEGNLNLVVDQLNEFLRGSQHHGAIATSYPDYSASRHHRTA